jgi:hypothetical protein
MKTEVAQSSIPKVRLSLNTCVPEKENLGSSFTILRNNIQHSIYSGIQTGGRSQCILQEDKCKESNDRVL